MATLHVQFSGLFLFARHPKDGDTSKGLERITALAVDARHPDHFKRDTLMKWKNRHLDGTVPKPHVGYVRIPGKYLAGGKSTRSMDKHEMVIRLDRQEIGFREVATAASVEVANSSDATLPQVADFEKVGGMRVDPACLEPKPADTVLARMALEGGRIAEPRAERMGAWDIPGHLLPDGADPKELEKVSLTGVLEWTLPLEGDTLTLSLTSFDDASVSTVPLQAVDGEIHVDLGNLCSENPLQWFQELGTPSPGNADDDFRWFYFLLNDREAIAKRLKAQGATLPVPQPNRGAGGIWIECMIATALVVAAVAGWKA